MGLVRRVPLFSFLLISHVWLKTAGFLPASAFSVLQDVILFEIYEENLASHGFVVGKGNALDLLERPLDYTHWETLL